MNTLLNAILFVGFAFTLSCLGPMIDDHSAEQEQAREAIKQQRAQQRFEKAAQEMCGMNAAWTDLGDGVIQCFSKKGRKTVKVSM